MAAYLFGDYYRSRGAVNGIPVVVRTEFKGLFNSETTVQVGKEIHTFNSRSDALNYLRNLEKQTNKNGQTK